MDETSLHATCTPQEMGILMACTSLTRAKTHPARRLLPIQSKKRYICSRMRLPWELDFAKSFKTKVKTNLLRKIFVLNSGTQKRNIGSLSVEGYTRESKDEKAAKTRVWNLRRAFIRILHINASFQHYISLPPQCWQTFATVSKTFVILWNFCRCIQTCLPLKTSFFLDLKSCLTKTEVANNSLVWTHVFKCVVLT